MPAASTVVSSLAILCCVEALGCQAPANGLVDLPEPRASRAILFSSRDPTGGNVDHGCYLAVGADGRRVLASCRGPGRITRIWSANPSGTVRIELDGQIVLEGPFDALLDGRTPGLGAPLTGRGTGGGWLSYAPWRFDDRCVVSAVPDDPAALYYQVGVELGAGCGAAGRAPGLPWAEDAAALLDPGGPRERAQIVRRSAVVRTGTPAELVALDGPGEVVELRITPIGGALDEPVARRVWLEVVLDGATRPSIAAPLGDLFGVAFDGAGVETLAVHGLGTSRVLRLPMPFRRRFTARAVPVDADASLRFRFEVAWRTLPSDHGRLPLRAGFRRSTNAWGEPFDVLRLRGGPGHYVGAFVALAGAAGQGLTFLEGDASIAVDGEDPAAVRGTGTEDDFNGAWYFRGGTFRAPWHALATLDARCGRVAAARFRGPDPVPFRTGLDVRLEHGGQNDAPGSDYAATAFWYGGPVPGPVPTELRIAWSRRQCAPAPVDVVVRNGRLRFDPEDPDHQLLRGLDVCVVSGGAPRVVRVPDAGLPVDVADGESVRVAPWLPSIRAFRVVGPFQPSAPRSGVDDVFGPERDASPGAVYGDVVGAGMRSWRVLDVPGAWTGYVDLNPLFEPNDGVVVYAACVVVSPTDQDAVLVLGSDDAVEVFLDGRQVHRHVGVRGSGRDQDRVPVRLRRGEQTLLVKVEDYDGGFGFHARFEGAIELDVRAR